MKKPPVEFASGHRFADNYPPRRTNGSEVKTDELPFRTQPAPCPPAPLTCRPADSRTCCPLFFRSLGPWSLTPSFPRSLVPSFPVPSPAPCQQKREKRRLFPRATPFPLARNPLAQKDRSISCNPLSIFGKFTEAKTQNAQPGRVKLSKKCNHSSDRFMLKTHHLSKP